MPEKKHPELPILYQKYGFSEDFPVLFMQATNTPDQVDLLHFHNCIELVFCEKGTRLCHYLFFNPEELLAPFYPNGLPEELSWYRYGDFPNIFSGDDFSEELSKEIEILHLIIEEMSARKEYCLQTVSGLIESLLVLFYRKYKARPGLTPQTDLIPQLFPAINYLDKEYARDADTELLAQLCGLSRTQFLTYFRNCFHQTPRQYLRGIRVRKACLALISTEDSILHIALQTGFQSLSAFNHAFRDIMGRSPQAFRKEKRALVKQSAKYTPFQPD